MQMLHGAGTTAELRYTLWVSYPHARGELLDHSQYLTDLQQRYADKGIAIVVALPRDAAKTLAAQKPRFGVGAMQAAEEHADPTKDAGLRMQSMLCKGEAGESLVTWPALDGAVDLLEQCAGGSFDQAAAITSEDMMQGLLQNVCDGGDIAAQVEACTHACPRSGRARALAVLFHWWCKGDLVKAREAIDEGIKALGSEAVPMTVFADLVLRGDRTDAGIAKKLAVLLAPAAVSAPEGPQTQLVYLRALLRAGQDRPAGRLVATMQKRLARPWDQIVFAETLMEAGTPGAFRDMALKAIEAAKDTQGLERFVFAARHKVLHRCGDVEAAEKLMTEYRASDFQNDSLNNDAWYTITRPDTVGRFDPFALAQCEEMQRREGQALDYGSKDTVALALFVNGKVDEAVTLQTEATRASNRDPEYVGRLTRFQAVAAERAKPKVEPPK
ncbi:MAG TPA: hypothetical protein VFD82_00050 [Planctomycetota bacterium]|nr:hypothetical protein [Planctomycetota bacterium]